MAIGSHGTGSGGTVGDVRTGRRMSVGKALSLLCVFVAATVETDLQRNSHWLEARHGVRG